MRRTKPMKLPNGFGQISYLKQNLRRPYRVMVTVGTKENGRPICKILKPQGYFETYNDAYMALMKHNEDPYEADRLKTLKQVYEDWKEEGFKYLTERTEKTYQNAWNYLDALHNSLIRNIRAKDIRKVLSSDSIPRTFKSVAKSLLNSIYDYAIENELVDRNYARDTKIKYLAGTDKDVKHHISFTDEEMKTLWSNITDKGVQYVLIQCYTGLRPGELCDLKTENIYLDKNYMIGGFKTKAGTDRVVPIHPCIKQFIAYNYDPNAEYLLKNEWGNKLQSSVYSKMFHNVCKKYQLNEGHRPHDPRKFFVTQAKRYELDEYAIKLIVGHAIQDITERVYTERETAWLIEQMNKINVGIM